MESVWTLTQHDIDDIIPMIEDPFQSDFMNDTLFSHVDCSVSPVDFLQSFSDSSDSSDEYHWSDSSQSSPDGSSSPEDAGYYGSLYTPLQPDLKPTSTISKKKSKKVKSTTCMVKNTIVKKEKTSTYNSNSSLTFSREELLKMTVDELEDRVRVIEDVRSLTTFEKKEVKRQRRMIKNRESAYASRLRKRKLVESMEEQVNRVQQANDALTKRVQYLEEENKQLKAKLASSPGSFWNVGPPKSLNSSAVSQTSTSLFIVLLSFGLLFAQLSPDSKASPFPVFSAFPSAGDSPNPGHVVPINSNVFKSSTSHFNPGAGRGLLMVDDPLPIPDSCTNDMVKSFAELIPMNSTFIDSPYDTLPVHVELNQF